MSVGPRIVAAVVFAGALIATPAVVGADQFVGERFAPIASMVEPALDVAALSVEATDTRGTTFVVTFSSGFPLPSDGYRIALSAGDPTGKRTRSTLTVEGGQAVGTVETGDGEQWDPVGPTSTGLDAAAGRATLFLPSAEQPPGSAVWVEVQVPTPVGVIGETTPYFSFDALVQPLAAPVAPGTVWGSLRDGAGSRVEGAERVPGAPPTVSVVNRALVISSPDAPPTLLSGQPVLDAADVVHVLDGRTGSSSGGQIVVNRVTGGVQLFAVETGVATEIPGAGEALVPTPGPGSTAAETAPPGTRTISIDLTSLERSLGLPDDPSRIAVAIDRAMTLGDGLVVTTTGVAATLAALEQAGGAISDGAESESETVVVEVDNTSGGMTRATLALIAGVGLLAVVGVAGAVLVRRQRNQHRSLIAEGWLERELAPRDPASPPGPPPAGPQADAQAQPVPDASPRPPLPPPVPSSGRGAPRGDPEIDVTAGGADAVSNGTDPAEARASQDRALAAMEAEFAPLIDRVDRLGDENGSPG